MLEPNTGGGLWNIPSADCYAGIAPRWYVDVWGDHNRDGLLVSSLAHLDFPSRTFRADPALERTMAAFGVTHVLSPYPQQDSTLALAGHVGHAYVYRIRDAARARVVRRARHVKTDEEAARRLRETTFDPNREILLHDVPASARQAADGVTEVNANIAESESTTLAKGRAVVSQEDTRRVVVQAEAPEDGFLLLADTFSPGWTAQVDGMAVPVYRANLSVHAEFNCRRAGTRFDSNTTRLASRGGYGPRWPPCPFY